jgi:signal transduction histidine kinase
MSFFEGPYRDIELVLAGIVLAAVIYHFFLKPRLEIRIGRSIKMRQDQFISLASHYLLTPISIIQAAVTTLEESDTAMTSEQRYQMYDKIILGQQRLWIVAEQLVLVNDIDQGTLRLQSEISDLPDVVTSAMSSVDIFARNKKIKLRFEDNTHELHQVRFDTRRIRQALIAVLDNAIKFSMDGGEVVIRLSYVDKFFNIAIEDHGIGAPENVVKHVAEKFYRGGSLYNFDYEGMGLGLHIAYAIIRFHQGDVQFDSHSQKGTVVTVQLPAS